MKVEIYDLLGRELTIAPTKRLFRYNGEQEGFARTRWLEKRAKWKDSITPAGKSINYTRDGKVIISADISNYSQHLGVIEAIQESQPFASARGVNGLGVTCYVVSSDDKVILKRRPRDNPHAPSFYDGIGGGWMSSANITGMNTLCTDIALGLLDALYEPLWQAKKEYEEESHLGEILFNLDNKPSFICRGLGDGLNLGISYIGKATVKADDIIDAIQGYDRKGEVIEHEGAFVTVDIGNLAKLLETQIKLQKLPREKMKDYIVNSDGTDAPMVDEYFGGFWAAYGKITGHPLPQSLSIENLAKQGIEIDLFPRNGENLTDIEYPFL
jgi:hypothetical protein